MIPKRPPAIRSTADVAPYGTMYDYLELHLAHSQAVAARAVKALRDIRALKDGGCGLGRFYEQSGPMFRDALDEITASGWIE